MIKVVPHYNKIKRHINDSLRSHAPSSEREVYCKRLHVVKEPDEEDCNNCPYFAGVMGGYGHECVWEDVVPSFENEEFIEWADRQKELMRVSQLIDMGLIKRG